MDDLKLPATLLPASTATSPVHVTHRRNAVAMTACLSQRPAQVVPFSKTSLAGRRGDNVSSRAPRFGQSNVRCAANRIEGSPDEKKSYRVTVTAADKLTVPTSRRHDEGASLDSYMRLPVSNYVNIPLPLDAKLERIDDDVFSLSAPKLQFFNLWVQPVVKTRVVSCEDMVQISAMECVLSGSQMVTDLRLTEAIQFSVETQFTWETNPPSITSNSEIKVLVDPPGPFALLPTSQLESSGNSVMRMMLGVLQKTFISELAKDYDRWAVDGEYRDTRAGRPAGAVQNVAASASSQ
eukprot:jgi/Tetstr1/446621/TSEL_034145.t1